MEPESNPPVDERRASRRGISPAWRWWTLTIVLLAGLAFAGGWLIGLPPGYTAILVGALVALSFVWMFLAGRRPEGALNAIGVVGRVVVTGVALLIVIQVLPIGRDHSNASATGEPAWSSPRTRELVVRACYSCHSEDVEWPWYSNVAPMSWAVSEHVEEGREAVNFSLFATNPGEAEESIEAIREGSMPPAYYTRFGLHSDADLSPSEQEELITGLLATPGFTEDGDGEDDDGDEDGDEDEDEDG